MILFTKLRTKGDDHKEMGSSCSCQSSKIAGELVVIKQENKISEHVKAHNNKFEDSWGQNPKCSLSFLAKRAQYC